MTPDEVLQALNRGDRVADVLRMVLQLSPDTCEPEFVAWVQHELDGYDGDEQDFPEYRVAELDSYAYVTNGRWSYSEFNVAVLPLQSEALQNWMAKPWSISEGVATIEDLIEQSAVQGQLSLQVEWPPQPVQILNDEVRRGQINGVHPSYVFRPVWRAVPRGRLVDVLDRVRTRVATELGRLGSATATPSARDPAAGFGSVQVTGSNNQITVQSPGSSQWQLTLVPGDVNGLLDALRSEGVEAQDLNVIEAIVASEDPHDSKVVRALEWAKAQALSLPAAVGTAALTGIVLRFFGMG